MGINLSESEWCRKATPEVPCRTQGISQVMSPKKNVSVEQFLDLFCVNKVLNVPIRPKNAPNGTGAKGDCFKL